MHKLITYFLFAIIFNLITPNNTIAQILNVDSMVHHLSLEKNDSAWSVTISRISRQYYLRGDTSNALLYANRALKKSLALNYNLGIAKAYANIAAVNEFTGNYDKAIENYDEALKYLNLIPDSGRVAAVIGNVANIYYNMGDFDKAVTRNLEALKIFQGKMDTEGMCNTYNNIGNIFLASKDNAMALKYYKLALELAKKSNHTSATATSLSNIGLLMLENKDYNSALANFKRALQIRQNGNQLQQMSVCYNNIGEAMSYLEQKDSAIHYFTRSLEIKTKLGDKKGRSFTAFSLAKMYRSSAQYAKALVFARISLQLSREIKAKSIEKEACEQLNLIFLGLKQIDSAYYYLNRYFTLKEEIINSDMKNEIAKKEMKFNFDKRETELLGESKQKMIELRDQKIITYISIGSGVLILLLLALSLKAYMAKNKANKLIHIQKTEIEEKHKEITDSINYAERIQRSFLATKESLDSILKDYFVFFQPKDIVSGDFYWASKLSNGNFILATADSTGHGVPGAIMSLLNITSLEKAVENKSEPSEILNVTRKIIIERLKRDGSAEGGKDGMDASLICINSKTKELTYSAANNPIWIIRENNIIELAPDKMPVGKHDKDSTSFSQHTIKLNEGDVIYTFTDGMADQFGGPLGKKFMYKRLKELLINVSPLPMLEQKTILETTFKDWVGDLEQVDDVTLVGVRV